MNTFFFNLSTNCYEILYTYTVLFRDEDSKKKQKKTDYLIKILIKISSLITLIIKVLQAQQFLSQISNFLFFS